MTASLLHNLERHVRAAGSIGGQTPARLNCERLEYVVESCIPHGGGFSVAVADPPDGTVPCRPRSAGGSLSVTTEAVGWLAQAQSARSSSV
jgi:hypothetical protein